MTEYKNSRATRASKRTLSPSRITNRSQLSQLSSKCVSEICTCGMHRCPKVHDIPFTATTTNQEFYRPYKVNRQDQRTPDYKVPQRHYDPSALQTTYNVQFVKKKAPEDSRYRLDKSVQYNPRKTQFHGETQYNSKYLKNKIRTEEPYQTTSYTPKKTSKFQGQTEYNQEFHRRPIIQNSLAYSPDLVRAVPKHLPFNGKSTYDSQFRPYKIRIESEQIRPQYTPRKTTFKGSTEYDQAYHRFPTFNYSQERCLVQELPPYPNKLEPGHDHLRYSYRRNAWK